MKAPALDLWHRAADALRVARHDLPLSPDAAASRAYYAAFYAVSAHFALQDKGFTRHSALEAAVHRDLVRSGIWTEDLGKGYSRLAQLRHRGDYGGDRHVTVPDAEEAVRIAAHVLEAVAAVSSGAFPGLDEA